MYDFLMMLFLLLAAYGAVDLIATLLLWRDPDRMRRLASRLQEAASRRELRQ